MQLRRRAFLAGALAGTAAAPAQRAPGPKPRNIIFILSDDHRYDALGFMKRQRFLETPNLDRLAAGGAHCRNAFVTTALCSPSRASILTGKYAFEHRIVDNNTPIPPGTTFFPQHLQKAGYSTAFIGKWHMGASGDAPQPGFDHWISFPGQGSYLPERNGLNIDGKRVPQKGYITDELTGYALEWLSGRRADQPYFLYLSHKAVHAEFVPAERHRGRYAGAEFVMPPSAADEGELVHHRPTWVKNQKNSWHGVEYPYHDSKLSLTDYYRRYAETLLAVDESVGRIMDLLRKRGELDSTLLVYAGDNGFAFGEHGLIDKRHAYEESMRIPLLAHCPEFIPKGSTVAHAVANIDFMPTFLETARVPIPGGLAGESFLGLLHGDQRAWRKSLLYSYYWERNYPQTPTIHAIRTERYKYIHCCGIWDIDELYDLQRDPNELDNLIFSADHQAIVSELRNQMFAEFAARGGMYIPLYPDRGAQSNQRDPGKSHAADFPPEFYGKPGR
jgi:N-acetylglucosamine-6-sulfatase